MSGQAVLLVCDWGTTRLRAWSLDAGGKVVEDRIFELGVGGLAPGEAALRFDKEVRPALKAQELPAVLCGMIGSNLGWITAPYADCPAGLDDIAGRLVRAAEGVWIAPGLRCLSRAGAVDVMRGEETQILGWIAQSPEHGGGRRLICHPGTHTKWVVVEDGRIVRFATAMTGELFAVLGRHSVLKSDAPADDASAFDEGMAAAGEGDALAARLFTARARVVGGHAKQSSTPSYLSGLLIGSEVASVPRMLGLADAPVVLLGDPRLCGFYGRALARRGVGTHQFDGAVAAVAGLFALHVSGARHDAG